jgi:predicted O-methyltransferase YrrM
MSVTPNYTNDWFRPDYFSVLDRFKGQPNIRFLEIGSFEGQSTNYFVNTILTGSNSTITCVDPWIKYSESTVTKMEGWDDSINEDTYTRFMQNTAANSEKIIVKRGLSCDILPTLTDTYDFIYVDGDHSEKAVWVDAVLSFEKLRVGGIQN